MKSFWLKREAVQNEASPVMNEAAGAKGASFGGTKVWVDSNETALKVAAWHRALELRAQTMGQLVMEFQCWDKKGECFVTNRREYGKHLNYLLQVKPNQLMNWVTMMRQAEVMKMTQGNAVVYVERDASMDVMALWLCSGSAYNMMNDTYTLTYNTHRGVVTREAVMSDDVIHIKGTFSLNNGITGVGTLNYAAKALGIAATNDEQALDVAAKGGKMKIIVQEEKSNGFGLGKASKKEMEKVTQKLNEDIYQQDVVMLNNIASVTPISQNAQQMELLDSRKFSVSDIARFTGVPSVLLMDYSNSSYKSPEAATQEFLMRTIAPAIKEWETEMNAKLIARGRFGEERFHLCERSLLRLDPKGQAEIDKMHLESGVKSVNELRADYDLPKVKSGDVHYVSTNLAEVGSKKLRGEGSDGNNND